MLIHFDVQITGYQQLAVEVPEGADEEELMSAKVEEFMAKPMLELRQKHFTMRRIGED